jgi:uncharacterized protein YjbK
MKYLERECLFYRELNGINIVLDKVEYLDHTVYEVIEEYPIEDANYSFFKVGKKGHDLVYQEALNYFNRLVKEWGG